MADAALALIVPHGQATFFRQTRTDRRGGLVRRRPRLARQFPAAAATTGARCAGEARPRGSVTAAATRPRAGHRRGSGGGRRGCFRTRGGSGAFSPTAAGGCMAAGEALHLAEVAASNRRCRAAGLLWRRPCEGGFGGEAVRRPRGQGGGARPDGGLRATRRAARSAAREQRTGTDYGRSAEPQPRAAWRRLRRRTAANGRQRGAGRQPAHPRVPAARKLERATLPAAKSRPSRGPRHAGPSATGSSKKQNPYARRPRATPARAAAAAGFGRSTRAARSAPWRSGRARGPSAGRSGSARPFEANPPQPREGREERGGVS
ncbi:MAG: hypothetical protein WKG07_24480 [Hymenobacter sp.]